MTNEHEDQMIKFADLVQKAIAQESANTKVIMEIIENLSSISTKLAERVGKLEDQISTIISVIKENQ